MTTATRDSTVLPVEELLQPTAAQRDIWAAMQLGADAQLACSDARVLTLRGPLDTHRLRFAIDGLIARHASLRATFGRDGVTIRVAPHAASRVSWIDLSDRKPSDRDASLTALCHAAVVDAFDMEHGPLIRFTVVSLAPDVHAVVIAAHQAVCDHRSFSVLVRQLGALYDVGDDAGVLIANADDVSPDPSPSRATEPDAFAAQQYWAAQFTTLPHQSDLPTDRPRPPYPTYRSSREDMVLSADVTRDLTAFAARLGVSMHAVLLGAFATLLSRLTGQDDVVVGTTAFGQRDADTPTRIAQDSTVLPLRCALPSTQPFEAMLLATDVHLERAFEHGQGGVGEIARTMPGVSASQLVSAVFNVEEPEPVSSGFAGLDVAVGHVPRAGELFDLVVTARTDHAAWRIECQYNCELLDGSTVSRWLANYGQLLRAGTANPSESISRLTILTDADEAALAACNNTARPLPDDTLVHELVEAEAAREPNRVAVEQDDMLVRYDELNARANQLAHHLRGLGVRRGELVGLLLERTPETIVALLAVLKAGAGYVPLDPTLPVERLERMANDASLAALITFERIRDAVNIPARDVVSIDGDAGVIALSPTSNPPRDACTARPEDPAYVIFTSGSTGRPKGVLVPHIGLLNLALSVRHTLGMHRDDVVLATTTLVFDVAVSEVLLPLTWGARIVLASRETAADGTQLRRVVESRGVTYLCGAPASYHLLLEAGWMGAPELTIICTGEAMPRELATTLVQCGRAIWNAYGPSETTVWSTFYRVEAPVGRILIGKPIDNTLIAIRDANGERVPVGVVGELFIGGVGVATGYLNLDGATAERFRVDPQQPGLRWYRTGDLVRLLTGGAIECLGRADDQVKVRGYRIEPGEIAAVVSEWPGVRQAVVVAREDRANDVRLVAYVIAEPHTQFDDAFRAHCKRILPQYMVPAAVVELDAFPLTASGKVDRKRLPAPPTTSATSAGTFVAPRTDTERMLVALWEEALGGRVGVRDDFFALGGHSLLASQILSRLRRTHGIELSFRRIFEAPTIEHFAQVVESVVPRVTDVQPIVARYGARTSPLTAQQERLCSLEELEPRRRRAHSHPAAWRLHGPLDTAALESALQALVERHAILRTSFHWHAGHREQRVNDRVAFELAHVDLSAVPVASQDDALAACFAALHNVPFEIGVAPLFRATLIALGPDTHQLYTLQHGLIWDGWSFDVFVRDLGELYAAAVEHRAPRLPLLTVTFGDFASWQQQWLAGPHAQTQQAWWNAQLQGARDAVSMPTDRPRPAASSYSAPSWRTSTLNDR